MSTTGKKKQVPTNQKSSSRDDGKKSHVATHERISKRKETPTKAKDDRTRRSRGGDRQVARTQMKAKDENKRQSRSDDRQAARSRDKRRSRSRERHRSRSKERKRSRSRDRRDRDRAHEQPDCRKPSATRGRNSPSVSPVTDDDKFEKLDARDYIDKGHFTKILNSMNWEEKFGIAPTFDDYKRFKGIMGDLDPDICLPFDRLYGRGPSLEDYIVFIERRQSRNWIELCGRNPKFEDYVVFAGHKGLPSWEGIGKVFGREPYFQEFMQYASLRFNKNWTKLGLRVPSFEDFMFYMIEIQSADWQAAVGRTPGFTDYVVYLHKMSSEEWQSLSTGVPTFMSYVAFKTGRPPPGTTSPKLSDKSRRSPELKRSKSRSESRNEKSHHSRSLSKQKSSVNKRGRSRSRSRDKATRRKSEGKFPHRSRSRSSSRATTRQRYVSKSPEPDRTVMPQTQPTRRYGSRSPDRVAFRSGNITTTPAKQVDDPLDILAFFRASEKKKPEKPQEDLGDIGDIAVLSTRVETKPQNPPAQVKKPLPFSTGVRAVPYSQALSNDPNRNLGLTSHAAVTPKTNRPFGAGDINRPLGPKSNTVTVTPRSQQQKSEIEKELENFLTVISSQVQKAGEGRPSWMGKLAVPTSQVPVQDQPETRVPRSVTTPSSSALILAQMQAMKNSTSLPLQSTIKTMESGEGQIQQAATKPPIVSSRRYGRTDKKQPRNMNTMGPRSHEHVQSNSTPSTIQQLGLQTSQPSISNAVQHKAPPSETTTPPCLYRKSLPSSIEHQRERKVQRAPTTSFQRVPETSDEDLGVNLVEKLIANEHKIINPADNTLNSILQSIGLDINKLKHVVKTKQQTKPTKEEELKQMGIQQHSSFLDGGFGSNRDTPPGLDRSLLAREDKYENQIPENTKVEEKSKSAIPGLAYLQASYDDADGSESGSKIKSRDSERSRRSRYDDDQSRGRYEDDTYRSHRDDNRSRSRQDDDSSGRGNDERSSSRRDDERSSSRRDDERSSSRRDDERSSSRRDDERSSSRRDDERSSSRRDQCASPRDDHRSHSDSRSVGETDRSKRDRDTADYCDERTRDNDRSKRDGRVRENQQALFQQMFTRVASAPYKGVSEKEQLLLQRIAARVGSVDGLSKEKKNARKQTDKNSKPTVPQISLPTVVDSTVKAAFAEDPEDEWQAEVHEQPIDIVKPVKPKLALGRISIQLENSKKEDPKQSAAMQTLIKKRKEEEDEAKRKALEVKCDRCDKVLSNKQHLKRHKFDMHTLKTEVYRCYVCGYDALQDRWLIFHMRYKHDLSEMAVSIEETKVKVPPFMVMPYCDVCKYGTFVEGVMQRHKCETLPRYERGMLVTENFSSAYNPSKPDILQRKTPAVLSVSELKEKNKEKLDNFLGDKPIERPKQIEDDSPTCYKCVKKFNSDIELKRHDREVHEFKRTVYRCFDCGFDSVRFPTVQKHMLKCHEKDDVLPEDSRIPIDAYQTIPVCVLCKYSTLIQGGMQKHSCNNLPSYDPVELEKLSRENTKNILFTIAMNKPLHDGLRIKRFNPNADMFRENTPPRSRKRSPSPKHGRWRSPSPKRGRSSRYESDRYEKYDSTQDRPFESNRYGKYKVKSDRRIEQEQQYNGKKGDTRTDRDSKKSYKRDFKAQDIPDSNQSDFRKPTEVPEEKKEFPQAFKPAVRLEVVVNQKLDKPRTKFFRCLVCNHDEQNYPRLRQHIEKRHVDYGEIRYDEHLQLHQGYQTIPKCSACSYSSLDLDNVESHVCTSGQTISEMAEGAPDTSSNIGVGEETVVGEIPKSTPPGPERRASEVAVVRKSDEDDDSDLSDDDDDGVDDGTEADDTTCPYCEEKLWSKRERKEHEHEMHEVKLHVYRCAVCGHDTAKFSALQVHYKIKHIGVKGMKKKQVMTQVPPFTTIPFCSCSFASLDKEKFLQHECRKAGKSKKTDDTYKGGFHKSLPAQKDDEKTKFSSSGKKYKIVEVNSMVFRCNVCLTDELKFKKFKQHFHLKHPGKKRLERDDVLVKTPLPTIMKCCVNCDFSSLEESVYNEHSCVDGAAAKVEAERDSKSPKEVDTSTPPPETSTPPESRTWVEPPMPALPQVLPPPGVYGPPRQMGPRFFMPGPPPPVHMMPLPGHFMGPNPMMMHPGSGPPPPHVMFPPQDIDLRLMRMHGPGPPGFPPSFRPPPRF